MDLFTEKLLLKDIDFSFSIKEAVKDILKDPAVPYRKEGEIPFYRRYGVQEKAVTEGLQEGQIKHWISTVSIDTYGEVMLPKGAQLKHYKKNPMVLWGHNYREPENIMGSNLEIEVTEKGLMTLTQFALSEEKAARVFRLYKGKHLRMWSVGFIPIKGMKPKEPKKDADLEKLYEWVPNPEEVQWIHQKWRLLEYSAVPIGANPDALTIAVKEAGGPDDIIAECNSFGECLLKQVEENKTIIDLGGLNKDGQKEEERKEEEKKKEGTEGEEDEFVYDPDEEGLEWDSTEGVDPDVFKQEYEEGEKVSDEYVQKPYPNEHACRLVAPAKFKKGSFRSYSRTSAGKVYRVIAGRLEGKTAMTEQSFRYAKDVWTVSQAKAHCKGHKGILFEPAAGKDAEVPILKEHEKEDYLKMTPEMFESFKSELAELKELIGAKEGAELSSKNRKIVQGAVEAMATAVEKLNELLEATEKPKGVEEEVEGDEVIVELSGEEEGFKEKEGDEVVLTVIDKKEDMKERLDFGKLFKKALDEKKGKVE